MSSNYRTSRNIWKPFTMTVNTGLTGVSGATQFALPLTSLVNYQSGSLVPNYRFKVDWGDGNIENFTFASQSGITHSYTASGTYSISIYGRCDALAFSTTSDSTKIRSVSNWGNVVFRTLSYVLNNATNLISVTSSAPILERVDKLEQTFNGCTSLTFSNFNSWNTSKIESLYRTFYNCTGLKQLNVSNWNISKVTNMQETFFGCSGLTALSISSWTTSNVTSLSGTFQGCSSLFDLDVSNWDVSKVTNLSGVFSGCSLLDPKVSNWNISSSCTSLSNAFFQCGIRSVTASNWDLSNVTSLFRTFFAAPLTNFYGPNLDLKNLTTAAICFQGTGLSGSIEISTWTLSSVQSVASMFLGTNLRVFDSRGMKVNTNLTNISSFLSNSANLVSATISNLINDSSVGGPFLTFANCTNLTSLDSVNWTRKLTTFQSCFINCSNLASIDVTTWNTASVSSFQSTFENCRSLTTLTCSSWTMSSVTTANNMFRGCTLSTSTYDSILTGWTGWTSSGGGTATIPLQNNVQFHAGNSKYSTGSNADSARNFLITVKGWTITDGGFV